SYPSALEYTIISPRMGREAHNQPHAVNGYLLLAGNARFTLWDIADPFHPAEVSRFESPHRFGEAESHQVTFSRLPDGTLRAATISGRGVDFWDLTDPRAPELLGSMLLEGVNYGDKTNAVWGVFWQGRYLYAGGTNTGLHVVDASDPRNPALVARVPTSEFGEVSAGPLFAMGNLLVVTTPKDSAGVATFDIGDPAEPRLLDFVKPERASYIGGVYGALAYLITPLRAYDVTTDPADIRLVASTETAPAEYVSFGDGFLFLGALRPAPGVFKYDLADAANPALLGKVAGRLGLNVDDQFSVPIGNLLAVSDDQERLGSVLAVHDDKRDTTPPVVLYANPEDGATRRPLTTRVGLSFSDQIDLTTVDSSTVILRPLGGAPLPGMWGLVHTHVSFWPDAPLAPSTT
ncbi:MAG: Ig-like domain-containing protein, partial [Candidatus Methylomirabilis sp.]|nr:Ig-like domain-containing protein [Deltaproteobacteria bacterium]